MSAGFCAGAVEQANADHPTEEPDEDDDVSAEGDADDEKPGLTPR